MTSRFQKTIIIHFQAKLELLVRSKDQAIQSSEWAASRMEARYDSDKDDYARLAGAIGQYVRETEKTLQFFKTKEISFFKKGKNIFVVAPYSTGEIIKAGEHKIVIIDHDRAKN